MRDRLIQLHGPDVSIIEALDGMTVANRESGGLRIGKDLLLPLLLTLHTGEKGEDLRV